MRRELLCQPEQVRRAHERSEELTSFVQKSKSDQPGPGPSAPLFELFAACVRPSEIARWDKNASTVTPDSLLP